MGPKGLPTQKALSLLSILFLLRVTTLLPSTLAATELQQDITHVEVQQQLDVTDNDDIDIDDEGNVNGNALKDQSSSRFDHNSPPAEDAATDRPAGRWGTPVLPDNVNVNLHLENSSITDTTSTTSNGHVPFTAIPNMIVEEEDSNQLMNNSEGSSTAATATATASMIKPRHDVLQHPPPEGFHLSAHIITNPQDSLSYFANEISDTLDDTLLVPFLECGAVGSTTPPIPLQHGHFRHFPKSAHPSHFMPAQEVMLIVALHPIDIQVSGNGEENRSFQAGDVVLVEDMLSVGHKMRADSSSGQDLSVLILTLPGGHSHQHHQYHRQRGSTSSTTTSTTTFPFDSHHIKSIFGRRGRKIFSQGRSGKKGNNKEPPCKLEHDPAYSAIGLPPPSSYENDVGPLLTAFRSVSIRRVILTSLGVSLSTLTSYFLSKVAPLQLAVGIGGACVIGGGTLGIIKGGEWACDEFEIWRETNRLKAVEMDSEDSILSNGTTSSTSTSDNVSPADNDDLEDEDEDVTPVSDSSSENMESE